MVAFQSEKKGSNATKGVLRGIGLVVLNPEGKLWVQRDLTSRQETGRSAGDLSIIFETKKRRRGTPFRESHRRNVLGALPELVNDATLSMIKDSLITTDRLHSTPPLTFTTSGGQTIQYVVTVGMLRGSMLHFDPVPFDETIPAGWMSPEELLAQNNVRPLARHAVEYLVTNNIMERKIVEYHDPFFRKRLIVPKHFSVSRFYGKRERERDMTPGKFYQLF